MPDDPEVRAASQAFVEHQISAIGRLWWAVPMWVVFIGLSCWLAVVETAWWSLAGLPFAGLLVLHLGTTRRLRRRRELLAA
ncbi:hypothetical protein [Nocardioides flavescens]|uniref:Uncharacterized protein n=1 Tax=Nocardioides flavescens TaxID=2691959 RepID=A0A6L7F2G4_9ACTN|nr:hypothetical protein [Nocardioides flavescens]MXG91501.1 hypothetical protein [Nocardioides flavescens]